MKNISHVLRAPGLVPSRCFLAPLGDLLVMKTLDDEWYVQFIKAYKLTVFEILRNFLYCHSAILHVRAIPTLESTDSMIYTSNKKHLKCNKM